MDDKNKIYEQKVSAFKKESLQNRCSKMIEDIRNHEAQLREHKKERREIRKSISDVIPDKLEMNARKRDHNERVNDCRKLGQPEEDDNSIESRAELFNDLNDILEGIDETKNMVKRARSHLNQLNDENTSTSSLTE